MIQGRDKPTFPEEPIMAEKKKDKSDRKSETKAETRPETKTSETVHLSADELRKISGGAGAPGPPPPKG
jgi:hypothetical protein